MNKLKPKIKKRLEDALDETRFAIKQSKENPYRRQTWLHRAEEYLVSANFYLGLMTGEFGRMI